MALPPPVPTMKSRFSGPDNLHQAGDFAQAALVSKENEGRGEGRPRLSRSSRVGRTMDRTSSSARTMGRRPKPFNSSPASSRIPFPLDVLSGPENISIIPSFL